MSSFLYFFSLPFSFSFVWFLVLFKLSSHLRSAV
jgi:hypothetical protein